MDPANLPSNPEDDARGQILGACSLPAAQEEDCQLTLPTGATLATTALAVLVLGTRIYVRVRMITSFGADDILMTVSTALAVVLQAVIVVECKNGHGRHIGDVPPENYTVGLKYNFISQPIVFVCTNMVKISIGAALLRIAATRFWKGLIWSIIGFMVFYTIGALFVSPPLQLCRSSASPALNAEADHRLPMSTHCGAVGLICPRVLLEPSYLAGPRLHEHRPQHFHRPHVRHRHTSSYVVESQLESTHQSRTPLRPQPGCVCLRRRRGEDQLHRPLRRPGRLPVGYPSNHHLVGRRSYNRHHCGFFASAQAALQVCHRKHTTICLGQDT